MAIDWMSGSPEYWRDQRAASVPTPPSPLWGQMQGGINQLQNFANWGAPKIQNTTKPQSDALMNLGTELAGAFKGNLPYADQALTNAFDPQSALYNQYRDDLTDSSRAGLAARGIAMSPYGAGVESNTMGRFLNDWQDKQIQRQNTGANTAATLQGQYQSGVTAGGGLINAAGQLNMGQAELMLKKYGLQGDMLSKALGSLQGLIGTSIEAGAHNIPGAGGGGFQQRWFNPNTSSFLTPVNP